MNKERNSRISLVFLLHNTVDLSINYVQSVAPRKYVQNNLFARDLLDFGVIHACEWS